MFGIRITSCPERTILHGQLSVFKLLFQQETMWGGWKRLTVHLGVCLLWWRFVTLETWDELLGKCWLCKLEDLSLNPQQHKESQSSRDEACLGFQHWGEEGKLIPGNNCHVCLAELVRFRFRKNLSLKNYGSSIKEKDTQTYKDKHMHKLTNTKIFKSGMYGWISRFFI